MRVKEKTGTSSGRGRKKRISLDWIECTSCCADRVYKSTLHTAPSQNSKQFKNLTSAYSMMLKLCCISKKLLTVGTNTFYVPLIYQIA